MDDTDVLGIEDPGSCELALVCVCAVEGSGLAEEPVACESSGRASAAPVACALFSAASFLCCSSWSIKESLIASIIIN